MTSSDRHLDLGCGRYPRNPYARGRLCGIDVRPAPAAVDYEHRVANLVVEPIPYGDASFASVSAFDFIEHVPRLLPTADGRGTCFPFIRLMNEIWRVLEAQGRFYALTPAFPNAEAFTDPTHVNIVTDRTHEYFCGDRPLGRMYGFEGHFRLLRCEWVRLDEHYSAIAGSPENRAQPRGARRAAHVLRGWLRRLRGRPAAGRLAYLLWEFEAARAPGR
jgi:SAM-dependent methyltransferase